MEASSGTKKTMEKPGSHIIPPKKLGSYVAKPESTARVAHC